MPHRLVSFARRLHSSESFEEASALTLATVLELCEGALRPSPFADDARLLRAAVHLRPGGAYRRVASREVPSGEPSTAALAHSASAWLWIRERTRPLAIDVNLAEVRSFEDRAVVSLDPAGADLNVGETRRKLLVRDATHLLVLPIGLPGSEPMGMVTIEADARSAIGTSFIWSDVLDLVRTVVEIAGPYLHGLPTRGSTTPALSPELPVIGPTMRPLIDTLRVFAEQDETILLGGATGAGKSKLAAWCRAVSRRAAGPFETLELATVPEDLQMAELFGWRRGAFTSAHKDSPGAITRADGGTLFIDEIDKLNLKAQAGLLRVLEERRYRPLGESGPERPANVRFIVGTNANLLECVRSGTFREDLYYRVHVLPVRVPALEERMDELADWAAFMVRRRHAEAGLQGAATLSLPAERLLLSQRWPGNLRQLDNIIRRSYALRLAAVGPSADVELGAPEVERALLFEQGADRPSFVHLAQAAAAAFVLEAERRGSGALDLDLTDALRGFVLGVAAERQGNVEDAFRLFGKESLIQHRNHLKTLRKELERTERVFQAFSAGPSPFTKLLDSGG